MKMYLVEVGMAIGGFEKTQHLLVRAQNVDLAESYALYLGLCCKEPKWSDDGKTVEDGISFYTIYSSKKVRPEDTKIIADYLKVYWCSIGELKNSGNFKEVFDFA